MSNELLRTRIGNTVTVVLPVLTRGDAVSLVGRDITIMLVDPNDTKTPVSFTIGGVDNNIATFVVEGTSQTATGTYRAEVYENYRGTAMAVYDCDIFVLVARTEYENDGNEGVSSETTTLDPINIAWVGRDGYTPYIQDGYWYINGTSTNVKAAGENGDTPYIENGYWYIGGISTGIKADYATEEAARAAAEIVRMNAELARAQAEQTRKDAEVSRSTNESGRSAAEGVRILAESDRQSEEAMRQTNEEIRTDNEEARVEAELGRAASEASRAQVEATRVANETARTTAEATRAANEQTRVAEETDRAAAETARIAAETARETAEDGRASAEATRVSNEQTRVSNESTRQSNESARQSAETARQAAYVAAENARDAAFAEKEATRDAANQAALNCADELAALGPKIDGAKNYEEHKNVKSDGSFGTDQTCFVSCKIPAVHGDSFTITSAASYIGAYAADDTFLDYYSARETLNLTSASVSSVAYIICTFKLANISTAKVEKGGVTVFSPQNVVGLTQQVESLQEDVETIEGNVGTLQSDMTTAQGNIENLQSDMTSVQNTLQNMGSESEKVEKLDDEIYGSSTYNNGYKLNIDGVEVDDSRYFVSDKIPAQYEDVFTITSPGGYIAAYKADGTKTDVWSSRTSVTINHSWNEEVAYIKCMFAIGDILTAKVEKGGAVVWKPESTAGIKADLTTMTQSVTELTARVNAIAGESTNLLHLTFAEDAESYIVSPFDDTYDAKTYFILKRALSPTYNRCFNYKKFCLVNKQTLAETVVDDCIDDIAPPQFNGSYLGGNHGDGRVRKLTIANHGLTVANIGEVWDYGTNGEATILAIVDANNIVAVGKNTATYPIFDFERIPADAVLTKDGTSLTVTAANVYQWYCASDTPEVNVFVNGSEVTQDGDYQFSELKICESYGILNQESVLALLRQGAGTYTSNPNPASFEGADISVKLTLMYGFTAAQQWTSAITFTAYQDIEIGRYGYTQQGAISNANLYIPKALPVTIDSSTIDFRLAPSYPAHSNTINITSEQSETPLLPPDRWVSYNDDIAIHSGYLFDYGVGGEHRKDYVTNYFYLPSNLKIYPNGIDNKLSVSAGDSFSAVSWRTFIQRSAVKTGGIIATNVVEYDEKLYLYADFYQTGIYEVEIPSKYVGKTIEVFEKSDNVSLLTPISGCKVMFKVTSASPMYGYFVAKIR